MERNDCVVACDDTVIARNIVLAEMGALFSSARVIPAVCVGDAERRICVPTQERGNEKPST
jgi:hypothetical protein